MSVDLEQFCQAIDIIITERLSDLSFDTTMICTITDASDKDRGHYIVTDGTIRFDAYTNDTSYNDGDQVRVSVLNGDFSEKKFIEGPYIGDTSGAPVTYISPSGTSLPLEENALNTMGSPQKISSFQINTNADDEKLIWEVDISNDIKYQTLQSEGIYNTITLSADFMTNLGNNISQGNYGLVLDLFIKKSKDEDKYDHKFVTFDSSEMIGNPYSFEIYSHQEKKINIAAFDTISMIRLSAYEGVKFDDEGRLGGHRIDNEFRDIDNQPLSSQPIHIKNIKLGFGNDLIAITDNRLQLYTTSSTNYKYHEPTDETNNKTFGLLWLNKTDTNEYLGYSDGIVDVDDEGNIIPYDEIDYRKRANSDSRLVAQMGKVGIAEDQESLTLAADIAEAEGLMIKAYELITTDLSQVLQALHRQLNGAPAIQEKLDKLIKNWKGNDGKMQAPLLSTYKYNAQQAVQKLVKFYSQILNYGYNVQNQIAPNPWNENAIDTRKLSSDYTNEQSFYVSENDVITKKNDFNGVVNWEYDYYNDFRTFVNNAITTVQNFFDKNEEDDKGMVALTAVGQPYSGYNSICSLYRDRSNAVIKVIEEYLAQVHTLCENDVNTLKSYKNKDSYIPYNTENSEAELLKDANKYCIYWYHYNPGFTLQYDSSLDNEGNKEYLYGNFAGANWKRITHIPIKYNSQEAFNADTRAKYLPSIDDNDEVTYAPTTSWIENTRYYIECVNVGLPSEKQNKRDENNNIIKDENGNPIWYYAAQPYEEDYTVDLYLNPATQNEKIKVIMFRNHEMITSNIIEFTNTDDVPDDKLVDAQDTLRIEHDVDSQDHYQVYSANYDLINISDGSKMRQLKCYYDGLLSGDETLVGGWLYWYVPTDATLLRYDLEYLESLGFGTDAVTKTEYSLENYVYFSKEVKAKENPTPAAEGDEDATEPAVEIDETTRTFVYRIADEYNHSYTNNTILVKLRLPGYNESINGEKYFSFSTFGNNGTKYGFSITPTNSRVGYCTDNGDLWSSGLSLDIKLTDANNKILSMSTSEVEVPEGQEDTTDIVGTGLKVEFLAYSGAAAPTVTLSPVEGSDVWNITIGQLAVDDDNPPKDPKELIGVIKATVSLYNTPTKKHVTLSTLYPIAYTYNPNYYASGPVMIVYNNQGNVTRISEEPFKLFEHTTSGDRVHPGLGEEPKGVTWSLGYYSHRERKFVEIGNGEATQNNIYAYMPKLNADNTITPAPMYFTYEVENGTSNSQEYYPVARCIDNNTEQVLWTQPIIITQNKYASATLNNWDGTFTIDEANGTLMTNMLGAGRKTEQNTFEGVLIGDIASGDGFDPDNADGIGIYGFNDGDQSFHFGIDGTAFLGKSGRGRILFDGNSGTISSASYQQNKETAGMKIDLDDGSIDMLGSTRTTESKYAPLKYQSFKIDVDSTEEDFNSNVINSDIGFLRYEKTWKDSSDNENISNILVDEDGFKWNIENIKYTTQEVDVPATYREMKYCGKSTNPIDVSKDHRDLYDSSHNLISKEDLVLTSTKTYYIIDIPAHKEKHIIPTSFVLTPYSDYISVGKYNSQELFENDSRIKYILNINGSGEKIYLVSTSWQANQEYFVKGMDYSEDGPNEKTLTFTYGYDEYVEIDMPFTIVYESIEDFADEEAFKADTREKYIRKEVDDDEYEYEKTTKYKSGTTYYITKWVSPVYDAYKAWYEKDNSKEIFYQDSVGVMQKHTFTVNVNQAYYEKIYRSFSITMPNVKSERIVEEGRRSKIHLDVLNPYLTISSAKQPDNDYIMYVGDNKYYLKSANYEASTFRATRNDLDAWEGAPFHSDGAGMKINLNNGHIDAYDFKLTSKNIFLDSGNEADPFMIVRDNSGKVLIYMGSNNYFLKSSDFRSMTNGFGGSGMKLDLTQGKIEAYGFNLRAGSTKGGAHEIIITDKGTSTEPYLQINTDTATEDTKTLVVISKTAQYFQSADFTPASGSGNSYVNGTGIRLSLSGKELKAYSGFSLLASKTANGGGAAPNAFQGISIDSTVTDYPLQVIGSTQVDTGEKDSDNKPIKKLASFKVGWDGFINAVGGTFTGAIHATSGTFSGTITANGTITGGKIKGASIYAANLYAGGSSGLVETGSSYQLRATASGVHIKDATISNCQITNGGTGGGTTYINNKSMGSKHGSFDNLKVFASLVVSAGSLGDIVDPGDSSVAAEEAASVATFNLNNNSRAMVNQKIWDGGGDTATKNASVLIDGDTTISGKVTIGTGSTTDQLTVDGKTVITGKVSIGTATDTADVDIYGDVMIDGTKKNLKLTPDGKVYVNAIGGNQFVVHAPLIFLGGSSGNKVGLCTNPVGSYLLTLPDAASIFLYYTGGETGVQGTTSTGGSLASYVENRTGVTPTDGDTTTYHFSGTSTYANNLTPGSGATLTVTLAAPAAVGAAGQVLSTTDGKGTSSWASLGSLLNTAKNNADNGKFLQAGTTGSISWTKLYVPSGVGTLNQVWATTNTTTGSEAANWTSISTLLSSMTGVANNTYLRGFKAGKTTSVAWSNICFPTSYSGTANTVWTTTTASGEDASGAGGWKTIPSLLGAITNTNQVLVSTGSSTAASTAWKTIGATLVNFTDGTVTSTITKKTAEDGSVYYNVAVPYQKTTYTTTSYTPTVSGKRYYLTNAIPNANNKITSIECTEAEAKALKKNGISYKYYGWVSYSGSGDAVTIVTGNSTSNETATGQVQINVSLT